MRQNAARREVLDARAHPLIARWRNPTRRVEIDIGNFPISSPRANSRLLTRAGSPPTGVVADAAQRRRDEAVITSGQPNSSSAVWDGLSASADTFPRRRRM